MFQETKDIGKIEIKWTVSYIKQILPNECQIGFKKSFTQNKDGRT